MSRIFISCLEAQDEIERDLYEMGIKVRPYSYQNKIVKDDPQFETIELRGYSYSIVNHDDADQLKGLTFNWCLEEFNERLSPKYINPGRAYLLRSNLWDQFLVNGKFDYSYNERIRTQLPIIIDELKKHPTTRQAIIEIHNNIIDIQNLGGRGRIPCSLCYQFMIREGKLDIYYLQRSCDFVTHWSNDVWHGINLMKYVASSINVPSGTFTHFITSLHAYAKDLEEKGIF